MPPMARAPGDLRLPAFVLCTVALALLPCPRAFAQRTCSLSWVRIEGAEDCISTQSLAERVEQRLGRRVFVSASQADLSLEGRVERTSAKDAVVATLVVSDREGRVLGRRVLRVRGESCQPLEASLVLVIAIAIDPGASLPAVGESDALSEEARTMLEQLDLPELGPQQIAELAVPDAAAQTPAPAPAAPVSAPSMASATNASARDGRPEAPRPSPIALRVGASLALEIGVLPEPAAGVAVGVTIAPSWLLPVDVWVSTLFAQDHAVADAAGSGRLQLFIGGLALCPALDVTSRLSMRLCSGLRAGVLSGRGHGFAASTSSTGPWVEAVLGTGLWLRLGRISLHTAVGAGVPAVRDTFSYVDRLGARRVLHRAEPVTGRFELGAGLHF
jgi:hypothetical protein